MRVGVLLCFCLKVICEHTQSGTATQTRYTRIHANTHMAGTDATLAVSGELRDTLILKLLMAIINHMILNHFRDRVGGGERDRK